MGEQDEGPRTPQAANPDRSPASSDDAFAEGLEANTHLKRRDACPYTPGTEAWDAWRRGWDEAERKARTIW